MSPWQPRLLCAAAQATHLTITEVNERNFLPACFDELGLEQFSIEIHPGTAVLPRDGLAAGVVGEKCHVDTAHEQRRQLDSSGVQVLDLFQTMAIQRGQQQLETKAALRVHTEHQAGRGLKDSLLQPSRSHPASHVSDLDAGTDA